MGMPLSRSQDVMKRDSLKGIPAGGENPYVMGSDLEEACRIFGEVVVSIASSLDNPGGH